VPTEPEEGPNSPRVGDLVYTRNHPLSDAADKWNPGLTPRWTDPFEVVERLGPETFNTRCPRGKLVKYHISQLKRVTTAIHQQAEDEIPAANNPPDDPDPPQRKRGRPSKPIPTPWANTTPDKTTRSEKGENLNQDKTPSPPAVPRRRLKPGNYALRARPSATDGPHAPKRKTIGSDRAAENSSREIL
jgi:hypothetical protein